MLWLIVALLVLILFSLWCIHEELVLIRKYYIEPIRDNVNRLHWFLKNKKEEGK